MTYLTKRLQAKITGEKIGEGKKVYRIPMKSKKRKKEDAVYLKMVKKASELSNECEVKSPVCTFYMQGMHHIVKKSPFNYTDRENLIRCCNSCNLYLETHDKWGRDNGFVISKFLKNTK